MSVSRSHGPGWLVAAGLCTLWATGAAAQTGAPGATDGASGQASQAETPWTFDRVWKFAEWYSDENNPVVQRLLFSGRLVGKREQGGRKFVAHSMPWYRPASP